MREIFISEAIEPVAATFDTKRMAAGAPGLPREFIWHGATIRIVEVRREWSETGPCRHGSGEQYVRKHWFQVRDDQRRLMTIYFVRHAKRGQAKERWQLFSMEGE